MEEVAWDKGGDKGKASSKRKQLSLLDGKYRTKYLELGKRADKVNRVWNWAANSKEMNTILEKGDNPKIRPGDRAPFLKGVGISRALRIVLPKWLEEVEEEIDLVEKAKKKKKCE